VHRAPPRQNTAVHGARHQEESLVVLQASDKCQRVQITRAQAQAFGQVVAQQCHGAVQYLV
jgi:hypothetical protein